MREGKEWEGGEQARSLLNGPNDVSQSKAVSFFFFYRPKSLPDRRREQQGGIIIKTDISRPTFLSFTLELNPTPSTLPYNLGPKILHFLSAHKTLVRAFNHT
jgi:hypothetical protein